MNTILPIMIILLVLILFLWLYSRNRKPGLSTEVPNHTSDDKVSYMEIQDLMTELGLPAPVLDLFNGNCTDEAMKRHSFDQNYTAPHMVLDLQKFQQDAYMIDRYKPLLAYAGATIFAYDTVCKGYISYDIEYKVSDTADTLSWQGLFVHEVLRWWEYELSDEDILHIGKLFGLKHTRLILDSICQTTDGKGFAQQAALNKWEQDMIAVIDDKEK